MPHHLFALESYDRSGTGAVPGPVPPLTTADTRLVVVVHLPADDVVLALVEGPDAETVAAAAATAGWRVDRLSPANWIRPQGSPPVSRGRC
ncbi:hypothetical protein ACNTMW_02115 [Planosporangium sp. 12N6]|uniref:hypothetical protein n=1 Tax=Planosporangium spinosum TaxID=3402278 RepID=UPI003CE8D4C4